MFNIPAVIARNNATFYDYRTGVRRRISARVIVQGLISVLVSLLTVDVYDNFLLGLITALSILVGFSFNVMFYLANNESLSTAALQTSLENSLRAEKLNVLAKEIFYNLAYFNAVALSCLVSALLLLAPTPSVSAIIGPSMIAMTAYKLILSGGCWTVRTILCFGTIESLFTFVRTINRVNFLFERRISSYISPSTDY